MGNKETNYKELVEALHENDLMYFVIGSLVSADSNFSKDNIDRNLQQLNKICEALSEMETDKITKDKAEEYLTLAKESIALLEKMEI